MVEPMEIERAVRTRVRTLRTSMGLSLDELATRANLSPSTLSRIETGKRALSLDVLVPIAAALHVGLGDLLADDTGDDIVIRPTAQVSAERTVWLLSRPTGTTTAVKMRLTPASRRPELQVHPGRDWIFVLAGRVLLLLGDREIVVEQGEVAEFATMTPHAVLAIDEPAELLMLFDRDGQQAHVHADTS